MNSNDYNSGHWKKKIPKYFSEEWAHRPSPFVQLATPYFTVGGRILELGTGAGQDGLWLETQGFKVTLTDADDIVFQEITKRSKQFTKPHLVDITKPLIFKDGSFDVVYAQLVLHYFDNETMYKIISEIKRVLKPGGVFACMVNSTSDPEYDKSLEDSVGLINVNGLIKRYFTIESFSKFIEDFEVILFDNNGRTPKDDAVNTNGMIQFVGRLKDE